MQESRMPPFWRIALPLLMGTLFLISAGSFLIALRHPSTVVDPQYYSHGVSYARDGGEAPWRLEATVTREALEIRVTDAANAPVTGGRVACSFGGERGRERAPAFSEPRPGVYRTPRTLLPGGDLRAEVRFSRGSQHSTRRMVIFQ